MITRDGGSYQGPYQQRVFDEYDGMSYNEHYQQPIYAEHDGRFSQQQRPRRPGHTKSRVRSADSLGPYDDHSRDHNVHNVRRPQVSTRARSSGFRDNDSERFEFEQPRDRGEPLYNDLEYDYRRSIPKQRTFSNPPVIIMRDDGHHDRRLSSEPKLHRRAAKHAGYRSPSHGGYREKEKYRSMSREGGSHSQSPGPVIVRKMERRRPCTMCGKSTKHEYLDDEGYYEPICGFCCGRHT